MAQQILLLHGAIGSCEQLKPLADSLKEKGFDPQLLNFSGHGGLPVDGEFSIAQFANDVLKRMDEKEIQSIDIFGYSMGGYVALYLAKHHPERVGKIMTVATKLAWNVPTAEKEVKMLDPEKIAEKVPKFAAVLEKRHFPSDWKVNLERTGSIMLAMGKQPPMNDADFSAVNHRVLMSVGDMDTMVTQEETRHVQSLIPDSTFKVLANTPHPVEQMNVQMLAEEIAAFFKS